MFDPLPPATGPAANPTSLIERALFDQDPDAVAAVLGAVAHVEELPTSAAVEPTRDDGADGLSNA